MCKNSTNRAQKQMCLGISRLRLFFRKPCKIAQAKKKTKRTFRFSYRIVAYLTFTSLAPTEPPIKIYRKTYNQRQDNKKNLFLHSFFATECREITSLLENDTYNDKKSTPPCRYISGLFHDKSASRNRQRYDRSSLCRHNGNRHRLHRSLDRSHRTRRSNHRSLRLGT